MTCTDLSLTLPWPDAALSAPDAWQRAIDSGLFRLGVSPVQGGAGGDVAQLCAALRDLTRVDASVAWLVWSQRLAIEALCRSPNVALREHLLPALLWGHRAGALSAQPDHGGVGAHAAIQARQVARGWRLSGQLASVPNLPWEGYSLVCPVWFTNEDGTGQAAWVVLRSEEDGLRHAAGVVDLRQVYFREDELLADDAMALLSALRVLDEAMRAAMSVDVLPH
jgi:alkylation response protein AidB-like acyl-CoA dehydrogenase